MLVSPSSNLPLGLTSAESSAKPIHEGSLRQTVTDLTLTLDRPPDARYSANRALSARGYHYPPAGDASEVRPGQPGRAGPPQRHPQLKRHGRDDQRVHQSQTGRARPRPLRSAVAAQHHSLTAEGKRQLRRRRKQLAQCQGELLAPLSPE